MDIDAELAAVRTRAARRAEQRIQDMQRDLRRAGIEDRRIIREAAGLPEPESPYALLGRALSGFVDAIFGRGKREDYTLRLRHELAHGVLVKTPDAIIRQR